jgi:Ca-activated chloride channel family protein
MHHEEAQHYLASLAIGDLDETIKAGVQAHVLECEDCLQELAAMQATFHLLQEAVSELEPITLDADKTAALLDFSSDIKQQEAAMAAALVADAPAAEVDEEDEAKEPIPFWRSKMLHIVAAAAAVWIFVGVTLTRHAPQFSVASGKAEPTAQNAGAEFESMTADMPMDEMADDFDAISENAEVQFAPHSSSTKENAMPAKPKPKAKIRAAKRPALSPVQPAAPTTVAPVAVEEYKRLKSQLAEKDRELDRAVTALEDATEQAARLDSKLANLEADQSVALQKLESLQGRSAAAATVAPAAEPAPPPAQDPAVAAGPAPGGGIGGIGGGGARGSDKVTVTATTRDSEAGDVSITASGTITVDGVVTRATGGVALGDGDDIAVPARKKGENANRGLNLDDILYVDGHVKGTVAAPVDAKPGEAVEVHTPLVDSFALGGEGKNERGETLGKSVVDALHADIAAEELETEEVLDVVANGAPLSLGTMRGGRDAQGRAGALRKDAERESRVAGEKQKVDASRRQVEFFEKAAAGGNDPEPVAENKPAAITTAGAVSLDKDGDGVGAVDGGGFLGFKIEAEPTDAPVGLTSEDIAGGQLTLDFKDEGKTLRWATTASGEDDLGQLFITAPDLSNVTAFDDEAIDGTVEVVTPADNRAWHDVAGNGKASGKKLDQRYRSEENKSIVERPAAKETAEKKRVPLLGRLFGRSEEDAKKSVSRRNAADKRSQSETVDITAGLDIQDGLARMPDEIMEDEIVRRKEKELKAEQLYIEGREAYIQGNHDEAKKKLIDAQVQLREQSLGEPRIVHKQELLEKLIEVVDEDRGQAVRKTAVEAEGVREKMDNIVVPKISFENAEVGQVFNYLQQRSKDLDPDGKGLKIIMSDDLKRSLAQQKEREGEGQGKDEAGEADDDPFAHGDGGDPFASAPGDADEDFFGEDTNGAPAGGEIAITMDFDNIPVGEAVRYISQGAGLKYRVVGDTIIIDGRDVPLDAMETRVYNFEAGLLGATNERAAAGSVPAANQQQAQSYFSDLGIEFPEGADVQVRGDKLVVTNTPENLDKTKAMVDRLQAGNAILQRKQQEKRAEIALGNAHQLATTGRYEQAAQQIVTTQATLKEASVSDPNRAELTGKAGKQLVDTYYGWAGKLETNANASRSLTDYDKAIGKYQEALQLDPSKSAYVKGKVADLNARKAQIERDAIKTPEAMLKVANAAFDAGDSEKAKMMVRQLLIEHGDSLYAGRARDLQATILDDDEARRAAAEDPLPPTPRKAAGPVNPFVITAKDKFSTFALEADTASYTLARRYIRNGYRPPAAVVRMEEFVNAFDYHYPAQSDRVFTVHAEAAPSPFGKDLTLLKVGVKGKVVGRDGRRPAHLVYVIDASGSMARADRMPLVKYSLNLLLDQLDEKDRITLIAYGTEPRLLLEAHTATDRESIGKAVEAIECGASTNMLSGVELGYQLAARHFRPGEINRVILCSDGVANVGATAAEDLLAKVDTFRRQGITFTSVGVGAGSYDDDMLEKLANKGDGNYIFLDSRDEARRVFVDNMAATLQTIAKDVKIQVEFNSDVVRRYRLIGYENRDIADKDFRNDKVDAGEIGSGQAATALYELELVDGVEAASKDFGTAFVRYKDVDADNKVEEISTRLPASIKRQRTPAAHSRFFLAACVAEFAEVLRQSEHARDGSLEKLEPVMTKVADALPLDEDVQQLSRLVQKAQGLPVAK